MLPKFVTKFTLADLNPSHPILYVGLTGEKIFRIDASSQAPYPKDYATTWKITGRLLEGPFGMRPVYLEYFNILNGKVIFKVAGTEGKAVEGSVIGACIL